MFGEGIIKGLAETARNFAGSYVNKDRLVTVQYPEERLPQKEAARNFPFLVYDGGDWQKGLRCVACQICEKECPPQCIYIVKDTVKKPDYTGKPQFQAKVFNIDVSVCMSCQICVEVCPFDAIKMDVEYELSSNDRFGGLLLQKNQLAKSNEFYRKIHPSEAAEVDARLAAEKAKAEAKAKAAAEAKARAAAAPKPAPAAPPKPAPAPPKPAPTAAPKAAAPAVSKPRPAAPASQPTPALAK
jgi:NADH-quinone oxidoreductase subunit I